LPILYIIWHTITIISQDYRACPLLQYAWTKLLNCNLNRLYAPSVTVTCFVRNAVCPVA